MFLNKATLIGNLTKDPEIKSLPSGVTVGNFSIATNKSYKDKSGNKREEVQFHNIITFGKTAEIIHQYVKKGHQIYVEGEIQTRSWDDKEGKKQYRTEILVNNFQFGNNPKSDGQAKQSSNNNDPYGFNNLGDVSNGNDIDNMNEVSYPDEDINPEDIPF